MNISSDIPIIGGLLRALGIEDFWFLLAIVFFVVCIVLAAALISSVAKRRALQRELHEANEYATGLEALTHLPPVKYTEDGELGNDSVVFASVREVKRMEQTGEIPILRLEEEPEPQPAPEPEPAPAPAPEPLTHETLASAIPEVRPSAQPVNVTAAVHDAILASVSGKHRAKRQPDPDPVSAPTSEAESANTDGGPEIRPLTAEEEAQIAKASAVTSDSEKPKSSRSLSGKIPRL